MVKVIEQNGNENALMFSTIASKHWQVSEMLVLILTFYPLIKFDIIRACLTMQGIQMYTV